MSIQVALNHVTRYRYDRPITLGPQIVRLRPAPHTRTPVLSYSLQISPAQHFINWQQDVHSNWLARLVFPEPTTEFSITVDLVAEMSVINPFDFFLEPAATAFPFTYDVAVAKDLEPYLNKLPASPAFAAYLAGIPRSAEKTIDFLVALNSQLQRDIGYVIRLEPGVQTPEETLSQGTGSCRDSAWLLCQLFRHCGIAARFVSGYLIQLTPDVKSLDGPSGPATDFTDLHAWTEVYLPGAGWVGLDPTSGLLAGEGHIPLAATPEPSSAAPITGALEKCKVEFSHVMQVTRSHESPRVTKPYSEDQWRSIEALGRRLDVDLRHDDVRLTMGGEPTFVSIDDMDGAEWNTAALGPRKRELAGTLVKRLQRAFAPGGLLHYGQGKWYPGESLPRWALGCYWRTDGQPLWQDPALIADESKDYGFGPNDSEFFIRTLAESLGVDPHHVAPAYEDAWYYLWKDRRLPSNVDPLKSHLENPEDRARLARVFEQGLGHIIGHALPLRRIDGRWASGAWFLRPEYLFLIPGDSPIGYRLPIDSIPWVSKSDEPILHELDPLAPRDPLPGPTGHRQHFVASAPDRQPALGESAAWIARTALCVEPRHGRLYVFMPPAPTLEDYLEVVAAVEATATKLRIPVLLEGYAPPRDHRLEQVSVTPDPGVIEVNLQPAHSWDELVANTTTLYAEARQTRLGTEKFMLDGRHTGTGGGNHIVLGGATPSDSPFLRRPDLLRSLVAYWHNHPALSFLFSGLFIGPTSQHPRVDEARNDALYELEIAFRQIPSHGQCPPWLVDRIFRNLLVDVTGNTHRAEFCIDKLYPPDSAGRRLGLVEFRAFEMPPHERMSLTQQLLMRALVARFWRAPYRQRLVRWGTEIHDRFMLPHFVAQDFDDVINDLRTAGFPLETAWFAPHFEFRFPAYGTVVQRGVRLELRQALEPWHVLGEESGAGGTVRYVDSSVERLQVKTAGLTDPRHIIACNGRPIPLHPTGTNGEFVAGVRYRAWQPPTGLHPTIGVHSPLTFDIVDTWSGRSIGGCTYHVMHPGGRNYDSFPVNAYEAESRRLARFSELGHTPGPLVVPPAHPTAEFPFTLDLRSK